MEAGLSQMEQEMQCGSAAGCGCTRLARQVRTTCWEESHMHIEGMQLV